MTEAYLVPVLRTMPPRKINGPLTQGGNVTIFAINPTETHAFYIADQNTDDVFELYSTELETDVDGETNTVDNCPLNPNPDQGPVAFGEEILVVDKNDFSWVTTANVDFVRGPLGSVEAYQTHDFGTRMDVVVLTDTSVPSPSRWFYYLLRPAECGCTASNWQVVPGEDRPATRVFRDFTLTLSPGPKAKVFGRFK